MGGRAALILAEPDDVSSDVVGLGLLRRGCRVVRASSAELALARWLHVPEEGTTVVLPDGTSLDDAGIGVVLNRLDGLHLPQFAGATVEDREYALAESAALLVSWLNGLAVPVANPPGGDNPWAVALHPLGWHAQARLSGLAVGDFVVASSVRGGACSGLDRIGGSVWPRGSDVAGWYRTPLAEAGLAWAWVFGAECAGLPDAALGAPCTAFVRALGLRYAALGFVTGPDGPCLVEVSPRPSFDEVAAERCADWLKALLEEAA